MISSRARDCTKHGTGMINHIVENDFVVTPVGSILEEIAGTVERHIPQCSCLIDGTKTLLMTFQACVGNIMMVSVCFDSYDGCYTVTVTNRNLSQTGFKIMSRFRVKDQQWKCECTDPSMVKLMLDTETHRIASFIICMVK